MPEPAFPVELILQRLDLISTQQTEINGQLLQVRTQQAEILDVLYGPRGPGARGVLGLVQETEQLKASLAALSAKFAELAEEAAELRSTLAAIQTAPGRVALTWWERVAAGLLVAGALSLAGLGGAALFPHATKPPAAPAGGPR